VVAEARRVVAKGQEALAVGGSTQEVIARLNEQLAGTQVHTCSCHAWAGVE
jgi:hypothetical protein